jgi:hypothetical protein
MKSVAHMSRSASRPALAGGSNSLNVRDHDAESHHRPEYLTDLPLGQMDFATHLLNVEKFGSFVPLAWASTLASLSDGTAKCFADPLSHAVDSSSPAAARFLSNVTPSPIGSTLPTRPMRAADFGDGVRLEVVEDVWFRCDCGKVELFAPEIPTNARLIAKDGRCVLCKSVVRKRPGMGVVAAISPVPEAVIVASPIYPPRIRQYVAQLIESNRRTPRLLTRQRQTPYALDFAGRSWNLDPSIFNVLAYYFDAEPHRWIVAGPSCPAIVALALLLLRRAPPHLVLPRFHLPSADSLADLSIEELFLLTAVSVSWKATSVNVDVSDLDRIRRRSAPIMRFLRSQLSHPDAFSVINRHLLSL